MNLQTKTTNTNTRNFFQKTFIVLAILAFSSWGFKAKAQNYTFTINNTTSGTCTWTIYLINAGNVINTITSSATSTINTACQGWIDEIAIVDNSGGCQGYTFGSFGSFPYTAVIPSCTPPTTSCSTGINCQGVANIVNCSPTPPIGDVVVTLNIN